MPVVTYIYKGAGGNDHIRHHSLGRMQGAPLHRPQGGRVAIRARPFVRTWECGGVETPWPLCQQARSCVRSVVEAFVAASSEANRGRFDGWCAEQHDHTNY